MVREAQEHVLRAGILCFPSNWKLGEKMNQPMSVIHDPVVRYDETLTKRVQRIFDHIKPDRPVWRANFLNYTTANLFQPDREKKVDRDAGKWVRVERQSLVRLPRSGDLVFGIHTHVIPMASLTPEDRAVFLAEWEDHYDYAKDRPALEG